MDMLPPLVSRRAFGEELSGLIWCIRSVLLLPRHVPRAIQDEEEIAFNFFRQLRKCDA